MRRIAAYRVLLLALLLAVSHVAMAVHVTAHSGADLGQCALCIGHAKSGSATLQSGDFSDLPAACSTELIPPELHAIPFVFVRPYPTRAPPHIS